MISLLGLFHLSAQQLNQLKFTSYTSKEGLANNLTNELGIDRHGYLWMSHHSGLSRFDGVTFKNFPYDEENPHGLRNEQESAFALDNKGRFWICNSAGLCWYDERHDYFNYVDPRDTSLEFYPRFIAFDGDHTLWITEGSGLYKLNTETLELSPTKVKDITAYCLAIDSSRNVWFSEFLSGVYKYNPATEDLQFYPRPSNVVGMYIDKRNDLWLSESDALVRLDHASGVFEKFQAGTYFEKGLRNIGAGNMVTFPRLTGENVLWIPTVGNGIVFFDMEARRFTGQIKPDPFLSNGLPSVDFMGIARFSPNLLWITSDQGGLVKLDLNDQQFQPVRFPFFSDGDLAEIPKIVPDQLDPSLWWISVQGQGLAHYDTRSRKVLQWYFHQEEDARFINDMVYDAAGRLWLATRKGPAVMDQPGRTFQFQPLEAPSQAITQIIPYGREELWMMGVGGVILYNTRTRKSRFTTIGKMSKSMMSGQSLSDIELDEEGNVYSSGFYGIHRVDRVSGQVEKLTESDYGGEGEITGGYEIALDKKGQLWFGTRASLGCYNFKTGKTTFYNDQNGFVKTACYYVFFDDRGYLWLLTNHGLCRMDTEAKTFKWYLAPGGASYLRNYTGAIKGRSKIGKEYYITLLSANFRFNPELSDINDAPATPLISQFNIRNQPYPFSVDSVATIPLKLRYNQNFVSFQFTAINFTQSERMQFKYLLEGTGEGWSEPTFNRSVNFTNLAPGSYTFKVLSANSAGVWSATPAIFKFRISPPWWATWWFRLLSIGLLAFAGFSFVQNRIKKIRTQAEIREREAGYKQREAELQREVAEFSKQVAEVELAALRAQMNPHFVFNCLNSINTFILLNDPKNASGYLQKFSKLIRCVLDASRSDYISLRDELDTLRYYVELEQMRYGGRFQYQIKWRENLNLDAYSLPPMLIQPYVENAIWHGLMNKDGEGGLLTIGVVEQEDTLVITVEDNGIGRKKAAELKSKSAVAHKSHGMQVTNERIKIINELYSAGATVEVTDLFDGKGIASGTRVVLKIPGKIL